MRRTRYLTLMFVFLSHQRTWREKGCGIFEKQQKKKMEKDNSLFDLAGRYDFFYRER